MNMDLNILSICYVWVLVMRVIAGMQVRLDAKLSCLRAEYCKIKDENMLLECIKKSLGREE